MRFGLPPHPVELNRVRELRGRLEEYVRDVEYLFVSHYHRDHFTVPYESIYMGTEPKSYEQIYVGKRILLKSPEGLNYSQRKRYYNLVQALKNLDCNITHADGLRIEVGGTVIEVSNPLPHGHEGSKTGYVIALSIKEDHKITFMPDVKDPCQKRP